MIYVHERVERRHPDLSKADVAFAWSNAFVSRPRLDKDPDEYLALGFDANGRLLEMVGIRDEEGDWLVYHALTPATKKAKRELGYLREEQR